MEIRNDPKHQGADALSARTASNERLVPCACWYCSTVDAAGLEATRRARRAGNLGARRLSA